MARASARIRWLAGLSAIPLLGIVGAFGLSPETVTEQVDLQRVVQPLSLDSFEIVEDRSAEEFWREERIQRGDSLGSLLDRLQVDDPVALRALSSDPEARPMRQLVPGKTVRAVIGRDGKLQRLSYVLEGVELTFEADGPGYRLACEPATAETRVVMKTGVIESSLFAATDASGLPEPVAAQLAEVFSSDIDFYRDLRKGDRFSVIYELEYAAGTLSRPGRILAAEFANQGRVHQAIYFQTEPSRGGYYTPEGRNMRKAFLRSPLEFSRITSGFSAARLHPVLNTWRAHKGIDYGAPIGTRVRATADGTVSFAGQKNGYGNVIVLRHANAISTLYGHLSAFARDLRSSARVQQGDVIGYVGMSGLATGPHLHYEFHVNGVHADPLKRAPEPGPSISRQQMPEFVSVARERVEKLALLRTVDLAALE
jgi:murein DD-endopeptidase MepM/ murein hydrolase activator NlpD